MSTVDILIEGVCPDDLTETFLITLMDFMEAQGISAEGTSIIRSEPWGDRE